MISAVQAIQIVARDIDKRLAEQLKLFNPFESFKQLIHNYLNFLNGLNVLNELRRGTGGFTEGSHQQ
jgi:hypothetical protein